MKKIFILVLCFALTSVVASAQIIYNDAYKKSLDEQYATGMFKGAPNAFMMVPADDPVAAGSITVFQYLQGRIPGLIINNSRMFTSSARWRMANTAYFLNEMQVDAGALAMINMNDIGLIKIFRPPFAGAIGNGAGGAIAVYTMRGDEDGEE